MQTLSSNRTLRLSITIGVALLAIVFVFPLYWMVVLGTHTQAEVYQFPPPLLPGTALFANFTRLINAFNLGRAMGNCDRSQRFAVWGRIVWPNDS